MCVRSCPTKYSGSGTVMINRNANKCVATKHNISFELQTGKSEVHIQEMTQGLKRFQFTNVQLVSEEKRRKIEGRHLASVV